MGDLARAACSYLSPALTQVTPRLLLMAVTLPPMRAELPGFNCSGTQDSQVLRLVTVATVATVVWVARLGDSVIPCADRNPAWAPRLRCVAWSQIIALGLANLEPAALSKPNMAACNNACWSLGASLTDLCIPLCSEPGEPGCAASNAVQGRHVAGS